MATRDWVRWHDEYDQPGSALHCRLQVVRQRIREALDTLPDGTITTISLCAGQSRDLLGALSDHPRRGDVRARLVELEPRNTRVADQTARAMGLRGVQAVTGDASLTTAYASYVPADLVLVCGVFGNVSNDDIRHTVRQLPRLCGPGATVVWTRHRGGTDITPSIRGWFAGSGFTEIAFDTEDPHLFAVGAHRLTGPALAYRRGIRLFEFDSGRLRD